MVGIYQQRKLNITLRSDNVENGKEIPVTFTEAKGIIYIKICMGIYESNSCLVSHTN